VVYKIFTFKNDFSWLGRKECSSLRFVGYLTFGLLRRLTRVICLRRKRNAEQRQHGQRAAAETMMITVAEMAVAARVRVVILLRVLRMMVQVHHRRRLW
jgi:hypothetical protein